MYKFYLIAILAASLTAVSQLLLKWGALQGKQVRSLARSFFNLFTLSGYTLLFCVTLLNVYVYQYIDLKIAVVLLPYTFVLVALLSVSLLKERFTRNTLAGSLIILLGIAIFHV